MHIYLYQKKWTDTFNRNKVTNMWKPPETDFQKLLEYKSARPMRNFFFYKSRPLKQGKRLFVIFGLELGNLFTLQLEQTQVSKSMHCFVEYPSIFRKAQ